MILQHRERTFGYSCGHWKTPSLCIWPAFCSPHWPLSIGESLRKMSKRHLFTSSKINAETVTIPNACKIHHAEVCPHCGLHVQVNQFGNWRRRSNIKLADHRHHQNQRELGPDQTIMSGWSNNDTVGSYYSERMAGHCKGCSCWCQAIFSIPIYPAYSEWYYLSTGQDCHPNGPKKCFPSEDPWCSSGNREVEIAWPDIDLLA